MRKILRFLCLLGTFALTTLIQALAGPSYLIAVIVGALTTAVLFIPRVRSTIQLDAISAGLVMLISHALATLFVKDNVFMFVSLASLISQVTVFTVTYLLLQGRLELEIPDHKSSEATL